MTPNTNQPTLKAKDTVRRGCLRVQRRIPPFLARHPHPHPPRPTLSRSTPGFEFFEASAKDNINVKQTFERLVDVICDKMSESLDAADPAVTGAKQGPQLSDPQAPPHQDCAC